MVDVAHNRRPARLPLYEHLISTSVMEEVLGAKFTELASGDEADLRQFFTRYCRFFREMTYDTVSFEVCITSVIPDHGAIRGGRPGPIQTREDFERFPWDELPRIYWERADRQFRALGECLPQGMKAVGGVGNGVFEVSEDLVGFEYLCYMQVDDPELFSDLFGRIGGLMVDLWRTFLARYADLFAVCRFGDDLGFKTATLLAPDTIRTHVLPQYAQVIGLIHRASRPFLWHSCGNIFEVMEDAIAAGVDSKHSNEDAIAPFESWIARYGDRIGLLGGIDVDVICRNTASDVYDRVVDMGRRFREQANGYALGSGNSIPDYVPVDGYLAMIEAGRHLRESEPRVGSP
jgi:uroporphyrinogen decarboxylase